MSYLPTIKGWIADNIARVCRVDGATHSLQTIDYGHHEIHSGSAYWYLDSVGLGSGATQDYLITTPNTTSWDHVLLDIVHSAVATVSLYEGADRIGTTLQTIYNHNRNSLNTAATTIHKGTSGGTTDGALIMQYTFGSTTGSSKLGGGVRNDEEIIWKQNTKYILRLSSATNGQLFVSHLHWYEHTNRD